MTTPPEQVNPPTDESGASSAPAGDNAGPASPPESGNSEQPFFVASTKEEYEAKFGPTRNEGRLSLAKKYGFETVEEMDAAWTEWQGQKQAQETAAEKANREAREAKKSNADLARENRQLKLDGKAKEIALELGANPKKVAAVLRLREPAQGEITAEGAVDAKLLKSSIKAVLDEHTYFKGSGVTSVGGGGAPAHAASTTQTLDQQISEAQKAGNLSRVISLQMRKAFSK